jgi:uncharacterized protein (DUF433 family)
MFGKPVIRGTRITVEQILRKLAGGMTIEEIITDHPHLRKEDILAAQEFASESEIQTPLNPQSHQGH